jgi:hypothetical protein
MLRTWLLACCLASGLAAQTDNTVAPIDVFTRIFPGPPSPSLFLDTINVSARDIGSYEIIISFTDPDTGKSMGRQKHTVNGEHPDKAALAAGASHTEPKPVMLPLNLRGSAATFSIDVDHVVFTDGTTWNSPRGTPP